MFAEDHVLALMLPAWKLPYDSWWVGIGTWPNWYEMLKWRNWSLSNSNNSYALSVSSFLTACMRSQSRYTPPDQRRVSWIAFMKCFRTQPVTGAEKSASVKTCPKIGLKVLQAWSSILKSNVVRLRLNRIKILTLICSLWQMGLWRPHRPAPKKPKNIKCLKWTNKFMAVQSLHQSTSVQPASISPVTSFLKSPHPFEAF